MKATLQHPGFSNNLFHSMPTAAKKSIFESFSIWLNTQEEKRFFWTAISLVGHGTFFTILTFATVILTGNVLALMAITCATMMVVLAVNLAALPVRYIIPVFFASLIVDALVIVTAIALW